MNLANPRPALPQASESAGRPSDCVPSILALDLGTTTGWAVRNDRCRILHGTAEFRPSRFEGGGMRYLRFSKWLDQTLEVTGGIDAIYFETVRRHLGTDAAHVFGGLLATLTAWCEAQGIPYQGVGVGTWKRHASGRGNADKQAVIAAMRERGFEPADDNEADAIAILLWAIETNGGLA
jgi:Holliday junction resolvasome RuvABC endonuclease subunit